MGEEICGKLSLCYIMVNPLSNLRVISIHGLCGFCGGCGDEESQSVRDYESIIDAH